jgi:hypothetical protein
LYNFNDVLADSKIGCTGHYFVEFRIEASHWQIFLKFMPPTDLHSEARIVAEYSGRPLGAFCRVDFKILFLNLPSPLLDQRLGGLELKIRQSFFINQRWVSSVITKTIDTHEQKSFGSIQ